MKRTSRHTFTSQERSLGGRHSADSLRRDEYGHFQSRGDDRDRANRNRPPENRERSRASYERPVRERDAYDRDDNDRRDRWAEETDPRSWAYRSSRIRQDDDEREREGFRDYSRGGPSNMQDTGEWQGRYSSYREDDARGRYDGEEDNENFYDPDNFEQRDSRDSTLSMEHEDEDYEDRDIDDEDRGDLDARSFSITGPDDVDADVDDRRIRGLRNEYASGDRHNDSDDADEGGGNWNYGGQQWSSTGRGSESGRGYQPEFDDRVSDRDLAREYTRGSSYGGGRDSMRDEYGGGSQNQYHGYRARGPGGRGGYRNQ